METACMRIKFTPFLQKPQTNSSKCCLEIVPEVSCVQNLDKLSWKQDTNFIEYTIPMTYKIILRKHKIKDKSDEIIKTYHSCVDLLMSSSRSENDLKAGNLTRISDTCILSKALTSLPKLQDLKSNEHRKSSDMTKHISVTDNGIDTTLEIMDTTSKETEECGSDDVIKLKQLVDTDSSEKEFCDKPTNTDTIYPVSSSLEGVADITAKPQFKRRLSLSPICSVNTEETKDSSQKSIASKAVTCKIYDSQKDLVPLGYVSPRSGIFNEDPSSKGSQMDPSSEQDSIKSVHFSFGDRSPPEIRIARYIQYMQTELLPLKTSFDKLISKCSFLGIDEVASIKSYPSKCFLYKSMYMCKNLIKQETCEKSESNRAVYSIVFDD